MFGVPLFAGVGQHLATAQLWPMCASTGHVVLASGNIASIPSTMSTSTTRPPSPAARPVPASAGSAAKERVTSAVAVAAVSSIRYENMVVGGTVITNIMLVSVTQRTKTGGPTGALAKRKENRE